MNIELNRYKDFDNYVDGFADYFHKENDYMRESEVSVIISCSAGTLLEAFEANRSYEDLLKVFEGEDV